MMPTEGDASHPTIIHESHTAPTRKRKLEDTSASPPAGYRPIQPRPGQGQGQGQGQARSSEAQQTGGLPSDRAVMVPSVLAASSGRVALPLARPVKEQPSASDHVSSNPRTSGAQHQQHPTSIARTTVLPIPEPTLPRPTPDTTTSSSSRAHPHPAPAPRAQNAIFHPKIGHPLPPGHPDAPCPLELPKSIPTHTAPRPSLPIWTSLPPPDVEYAARIQENEAKPRLPLHHHVVPPVWAPKRRGLTSALEYYARPLRTMGGTVHVDQGGVARGIVFEGPLGEGYAFWGTGKSAGTFVVPFGNTRKRGKVPHNDSALPEPIDARGTARPIDPIPPPRCPTPPPIVHENIARILAPTDGRPQSPTPTHELPEINALLRAHRARIPIAVGITQDTTLVPFALPGAYLILGWFWITDAWPEPTGAAWSDLNIPWEALGGQDVGIRWRFRFDWCTTGQAAHPWWELPQPGVTPLFMSMKDPVPLDEVWVVDGPEADLTQTVRRQRREAGTEQQDGWLPCTACGHASAEVYIDKRYCLNINCDVWFFDRATQRTTAETSPRRIILRSPRRCRRYGPDELGMTLRPPLPQELAEPDPADAGKTFWKGWVCSDCGCGNERKAWKGWDCENCTNKWYPDRKIWSVDELPPSRRVTESRRDANFSTTPSLDPHMARFAGEVTMSSTIWRDGTKACFYGMRNRNEMTILIAPATPASTAKTNEIFQLLQMKDNVNFRRTPDQQPSTKLEEKCYSPLYTFLAGPPETPMLEGLPSYKPVLWQVAPKVCVQAIGRINDLCTRVVVGERRFNSLLCVCPPPDLPEVLVPWIRVPQYSTFAVMYLGSGGSVVAAQPELIREKARDVQGQIEVENGDIVVVRSFEVELDLGLKSHGFGFFCIARQIYPESLREGLGQPLASYKRKEPTLRPREWPLEAVALMKQPGGIPSSSKSDSSFAEQGWFIGNIPIWEKAAETTMPTPPMPLST